MNIKMICSTNKSNVITTCAIFHKKIIRMVYFDFMVTIKDVFEFLFFFKVFITTLTLYSNIRWLDINSVF